MKVNMLLRSIDPRYFSTINNESWVGVDYGAYFLIKHGVTPIYAFGDFDSVSDEELELIKHVMDVDIVPTMKDFTDFELSLRHVVEKGYHEIDVYGALGGRVDHELVNIQTLVHEDFVEQDIRLLDEWNVIAGVRAGNHELTQEADMRYVSVIPMFEGTRVTLSGLLYEAQDVILEIGKTLTVSNEFVEGNDAFIETNKPLIVVQSRDR